jgi:hypothetical protein
MERDAAQRRARTAETELATTRTKLADQKARHPQALDVQRGGCEKKLAVAGVPAAVNPAEWEAVCNESGEVPDGKALTFGLNHRFENPAAILAFSLRRCTVTDPAGITTSATTPGRYYQYPQQSENASTVRRRSRTSPRESMATCQAGSGTSRSAARSRSPCTQPAG